MEIRKIESRFWGFAYVRPSSEKKVLASLAAMQIPCYLPVVPKARMQHSTKIVSYVPMIPSYVFLCADEMERSDIKRQEKRIINIELLRERACEENFIRELNVLQQCEKFAQEAPAVVNPGIIAGDTVMITSGALAGLETTVCARKDEENLITVNLSILNKHVEYPVSAELLRKITE